eukprot:3749-Heterococcus_DN1.PRE.1
MTRWPLDPYANNTSIVVEPSVPRVVNTLPMLDGSVHNSSSTAATVLSSIQPSELSSPSEAAAVKHTAVQQQQQQQQQQHPMAPLATVIASTATVTAAAAVAAVTQATTTSAAASTAAVTAPTAAPAVRRKPFMRWYSGLRGVFILMIVTSHIQIGLSNSGVKPNEDQWGAWI